MTASLLRARMKKAILNGPRMKSNASTQEKIGKFLASFDK
jgi:hypothetical protein